MSLYDDSTMARKHSSSRSFRHNMNLRSFLAGLAMGAADVVPGVSGGTMAFIFGIYQELLLSIKKLTGEVPHLLLKRQWRKAQDAVNWGFLVPLGLGIVIAIVTLARLLRWFLADSPVMVWSFFFGLVVASVVVVLRKRVKKWDVRDRVWFVVAVIVSYVVVGAVPVETPRDPFTLFLSGVVAISAMILPGISGSFILVILGKYGQVLDAVATFDIFTLLIFAAGCVVGLALFVRVLTWLFAKHHDIAIVVLAGVMVGSLRKIWPWKEVVRAGFDHHGNIVPLLERNVLPYALNMEVFFALILAIAGIVLITYVQKLHGMKETHHITSKEA